MKQRALPKGFLSVWCSLCHEGGIHGDPGLRSCTHLEWKEVGEESANLFQGILCITGCRKDIALSFFGSTERLQSGIGI